MKPTPIEPRTSLECWRARRVVGVASCARATSGLARDQGEPSAPRSVLVQALPSCRDLLGCLLKRTPSLHRHCLTFQVLVDREEPPPWACGESRWARVMLGAVGGGAERWRGGERDVGDRVALAEQAREQFRRERRRPAPATPGVPDRPASPCQRAEQEEGNAVAIASLVRPRSVLAERLPGEEVPCVHAAGATINGLSPFSAPRRRTRRLWS